MTREEAMFCSGFHSAPVSTLAMNQGCIRLHKMSTAPGIQPSLSLSPAGWQRYLTLIAKFESASASLSVSDF